MAHTPGIQGLWHGRRCFEPRSWTKHGGATEYSEKSKVDWFCLLWRNIVMRCKSTLPAPPGGAIVPNIKLDWNVDTNNIEWTKTRGLRGAIVCVLALRKMESTDGLTSRYIQLCSALIYGLVACCVGLAIICLRNAIQMVHGMLKNNLEKTRGKLGVWVARMKIWGKLLGLNQ